MAKDSRENIPAHELCGGYLFGVTVYRVPTHVLYGLKRSYFRFSIHKAIRKVLFLGILVQRSYKGLILNATESFQILDNFHSKKFLNFLESANLCIYF